MEEQILRKSIIWQLKNKLDGAADNYDDCDLVVDLRGTLKEQLASLTPKAQRIEKVEEQPVIENLPPVERAHKLVVPPPKTPHETKKHSIPPPPPPPRMSHTQHNEIEWQDDTRNNSSDCVKRPSDMMSKSSLGYFKPPYIATKKDVNEAGKTLPNPFRIEPDPQKEAVLRRAANCRYLVEEGDEADKLNDTRTVDVHGVEKSLPSPFINRPEPAKLPTLRRPTSYRNLIEEVDESDRLKDGEVKTAEEELTFRSRSMGRDQVWARGPCNGEQEGEAEDDIEDVNADDMSDSVVTVIAASLLT
jgi:hypothetical protein